MLKHELTHLVLSLIAAGSIYWYFRKWQVILVALLSGFLVDADHLFDYFLYKKAFIFNFSEFISGNYFRLAGKVYLPFHAFEYAIIAIIAGLLILKFTKEMQKHTKMIVFLLLVFGISLSFHLAFDMFSYRPNWPAYFISYRITHNFDHNGVGF